MNMAQNIGFIAGVEADIPKFITNEEIISWWSRPFQLTQWTFAASPGYYVIRNIINASLKLLNQTSSEEIVNLDVLNAPGPGIWTDGILDSWKSLGFDPLEFREFGETARVVNDQLILPLTSFNPNMEWDFGNMGSKPISHKYSFVQHLYDGSWKH